MVYTAVVKPGSKIRNDGTRSLVITLPAQWCEYHNLKVGDKIGIATFSEKETNPCNT